MPKTLVHFRIEMAWRGSQVNHTALFYSRCSYNKTYIGYCSSISQELQRLFGLEIQQRLLNKRIYKILLYVPLLKYFLIQISNTQSINLTSIHSSLYDVQLSKMYFKWQHSLVRLPAGKENYDRIGWQSYYVRSVLYLPRSSFGNHALPYT